MADLGYRLTLAVLPRAVHLLTRAWFATCPVTVTGIRHLEATTAAGPTVAVFWHYSFAYTFYLLRGYRAAVMVSASRDGEYIARIAKLYGHLPVRGSSNQGGLPALRGLIGRMRDGGHAGIVGDGSQGPARKLQPGVILLSAKTGAPVLPLAWAAERYIAFNSWDRTVLPKPFSRIHVRFGHPMAVPADVRGEGVEHWRNLVEAKLNDLYDQVWQQAGQAGHDLNRESDD